MSNRIPEEFVKFFNITLTEKEELEKDIDKNLELYGKYSFEDFMNFFVTVLRGVNMDADSLMEMLDGWQDPEIAEDFNPYPEEYSVGLILFDDIDGAFYFRNNLQKCMDVNHVVTIKDVKDILEINPFCWIYTIPFYMKGQNDSDKDYGWREDDICWDEIFIERTKVCDKWAYFLDCATLPRNLKEE